MGKRMVSSVYKFDDASWHEHDASNRLQASLHIAFMYLWLVRRGLLTESVILSQTELAARSLTPGASFDKWSDGKLVSEAMTQDAAAFLKQYYDGTHQYFTDAMGKKLKLARETTCKSPYDLQDSWRNADKVAVFLDKKYAAWIKGQEQSDMSSFERIWGLFKRLIR